MNFNTGRNILDHMGPNDVQRPRDQNTFNSNVFGAPIDEKTNRKILGFGKDHGKDNLIGPEK